MTSEYGQKQQDNNEIRSGSLHHGRGDGHRVIKLGNADPKAENPTRLSFSHRFIVVCVNLNSTNIARTFVGVVGWPILWHNP